MGIREEQKEKRRSEILSAGLDLFIRKGYSATKIKDIAEQVGMSVGLLFHYFESKEVLYEELISMGLQGPMNVMAVQTMEPLDFFKTAADMILSYIKADPFTAKMFVLMGQAFYNEAAPLRVKNLLKGFDVNTPTTFLIQKGQENGTIRKGDPYALSIVFWGAIQGIAMQLSMTPDAPCPESEWIIDMIRRKAE